MEIKLGKIDLFYFSLISEEEFRALLSEYELDVYNDVHNNEIRKYVLKKKFLNTDRYISFYFKNNRLSRICINLSQTENKYSYFMTKETYKKNNKVLNELYGHSFFGIFSDTKVWRLKNITIKHYIFERFCWEEWVDIFFNKNK